MSYFDDFGPTSSSMRLRSGPVVDEEKGVFPGWCLFFPSGYGRAGLTWLDVSSASRARVEARARAQELAGTEYYAPLCGRPYTVRMERVGRRLRVFSNGGFLFDAEAPSEVAEDARFTLGFGAIYQGAIVQQAAAWRIKP